MTNIVLLQTERDKQSAACADDIIDAAKAVAEQRKGDIAGFVIVAWSADNVATAYTRVWDMGRLPKQLVAEFIKGVVAEDITMRNVLHAIADADEAGGAA